MDNNNGTMTINLDESTTVTFTKVGGVYMVSTSDIARVFNKDHKDMIKHMKAKSYIENGEEVNIWNSRGVGEITHSSWTNSNNKTHVNYLFTKQSFDIFVLGFTGPVANYYKVKYVEAFHKLEAMVARVARGEINLSVEASELISNITNLDGLWSMGYLSSHINDNRKGANISRTKLYQLFRDMGYITQKENRNTVLADAYLTTVLDTEHNTTSVKSYKRMVPSLIKRITTFLESNPTNPFNGSMGEMNNKDIDEAVTFVKTPSKEEPIFKVSDNSEEAFMDAVGLKQSYKEVNNAKHQYDKLIDGKVRDYIEDNNITYDTTLIKDIDIPKGAKPKLDEGGEVIGYTKTIAGTNCTTTWTF